MPKLDILFIFSRMFEFILGQGTSWRQAWSVVAQPNNDAKARPDVVGWASVSTGYSIFFSSSMPSSHGVSYMTTMSLRQKNQIKDYTYLRLTSSGGPAYVP